MFEVMEITSILNNLQYLLLIPALELNGLVNERKQDL